MKGVNILLEKQAWTFSITKVQVGKTFLNKISVGVT